jgi:high-affinity Fe2+/Pb2+ permease
VCLTHFLLHSTCSEALEASVIVSIMLKFLDKVARPELKRDVWIGTLAGFLCALAVGVGFVSAYYTLNKNYFVDKTEQLFEGFVMLFASVVIAILAVGMLQVLPSQNHDWRRINHTVCCFCSCLAVCELMSSCSSYYKPYHAQINKFREIWERKLQASLDKAQAQGTKLAGSTMFWIPFVSVLREGIEGVLFLTGASAGYPARSIPIPGILGLVIGVLVGFALFRAGSQLNIHRFMVASTAVLLVIAAGLLSRSSHEFQEAGAFGKYENEDGDIMHTWNQSAWDICDCCSHDTNDGWAIVRSA